MLATALLRNSHTLLALTLAFGGIVAEGAVVEWLYRVETPVSSRTTADRYAAAQRALDTMLMRLTGLAQVPRTPVITAALATPERYYQRYSFVADADETRLAVSFAPEALRELVAEARLPIWAADRPVALAWIVVEGTSVEPATTLSDLAAETSLGTVIPLGSEQPEAAVEPSPAISETGGAEPSQALASAVDNGLHTTGDVVLSSTSRHPLATALRKRSRERGIEILLPLMDLEDRERIQPTTLINAYAYTIREASARYRPDYILLGRARRGASVWVTDWHLWLEGVEPPLVDPTPDFAVSAIRAVDAASDVLAQRFAVTGVEPGLVTLEVRGVNSVADYASVLQHLEELAFIDRVELVEANTDALRLRVATRSSRARLGDLLAAGEVFERVASAPDSNDAAAPMRLWWAATSLAAAAAPQRRR